LASSLVLKQSGKPRHKKMTRQNTAHGSCSIYRQNQYRMQKHKILVVDDDPKLSRLVKAILEKTNLYEVQEENRSSAAIAAAKAFMPDMILLDVDMPGKDGGDVARDLQADRVLRDTPVLFLTSLISQAEARQRAVERGGMLFLAKPVDPAVLVGTIGRILKQQPAAAK
jgi:two-component system OmpR family response regulator